MRNDQSNANIWSKGVSGVLRWFLEATIGNYDGFQANFGEFEKEGADNTRLKARIPRHLLVKDIGLQILKGTKWSVGHE
jgi:hypothetical protein